MSDTWVEIIILFIGIFIGVAFRSWLYSRTHYIGIIRVTKDAEKTLYSLELDDSPEILGKKKKAVFRVDSQVKHRL
jgi:hypothetical protein